MNKQRIAIIACVTMYAAVWPQNSENEVISVKQEKPVISADVAATQEKLMQIIFSADTQSPGPAETEESTTEKEQASSSPDEAILEPEATGAPEPTSTPSSDPQAGDNSCYRRQSMYVDSWLRYHVSADIRQQSAICLHSLLKLQ